jgi:beta-N-acetylhexosaminidase
MGSPRATRFEAPALRPLSRRDLLRGLVLGSVAAGLAACGISPGTPDASGGPSAVPSGPSATGPSAGASQSPVPAPPATPTPAPTPTPRAVAGLTLREKVGRLLVVGFTGRTAVRGSAVARAIAAGELGGVILFDRNIASAAQLADLTGGLAALAPGTARLIIAVDQEGGRVTRLGPAHGFDDVPSQAAVGARDTDYAQDVYSALAATLSDAGVNLNLAPVVDVNVNPRNPAVGALDRAFSADPAVVTMMARAAIQAHHGRGVLTTLKHFPGLGSATANTDLAAVDVTKTWLDVELDPYRDLLVGDADCVMVGHMLNRTIDAKLPASLSAATVRDLLRGELGWQGPVITDDLQAAAISKHYRRTDAIAAALNAGVDLLLFASAPTDPKFYGDLVTTVVNLVATGRVPEARIDEAVARVAVLRSQL